MIFKLRNLKSRSASAENPMALEGQGGMEGKGLKGSPAIKDFKAGTTEVLLDVKGPGMIRHIWMTTSSRMPRDYRNIILRMYWDKSDVPSVEVPLGDFFGAAHGVAVPLYSKYITMQEGRGLNCYFPMPFSSSAIITITNETDYDIDWFFYQIDFTLGDKVDDDDGRFHSAFNRKNPCPMGDFIILNTSGARGLYFGCNLGVRPLTEGWWGEGEVKIYIDNDDKYPTICGTGIEDYFGSAWGLGEHCALYQGAHFVKKNFASLYHFHHTDPIYFQNRIKVTIQQLGCGLKSELLKLYGDKLVFQPKNHPRRHKEDGFYLRSDDYCATSYWYQYPLITKREPIMTKEYRSANLYNADDEKPTVEL